MPKNDHLKAIYAFLTARNEAAAQGHDVSLLPKTCNMLCMS
jgi:hypothetical protein